MASTNGHQKTDHRGNDAASLVQLTLNGGQFPFPTSLNFRPLIDYILREGTGGEYLPVEFVESIRRELEGKPELLEPITDPELLERYSTTIERLMCVVMPPVFWHRDMTAAVYPFSFRSFYATPNFRKYLLNEEGMLTKILGATEEVQAAGKALNAFILIAQKFYGLDFGMNYPLLSHALDDRGLDRYFKIMYDPRFVEIRQLGKLKKITESEKAELRASVTDLDLWKKILPPENFEFSGLVLVNAIDVTDQEVVSAMKRDLIENDSLVSSTRFETLQQHVRTLLGKPDISLGMVTMLGDKLLMVNSSTHSGSDCVFTDAARYNATDFVGSVYERAMKGGEVVVIDDMATQTNATTMVEEEFLRKGLRNAYIAPLRRGGETLGFLFLSSPHPGDLNLANTLKLIDVLPLFSIGVARGIEDMNNRVEKIIREHYTSIHPSVEWRFRKAALNMIDAENAGGSGDPEPIVFENILPLYSVTDIRGSSTARNASIQRDLTDQLSLARRVIERAMAARPLAILANVVYRIDQIMQRLEEGISAGDESAVLSFLRENVECLFGHLATFDPAVEELIEAYRAAIDPQHGFIYNCRKDYEESVAAINRTVSAYIEEEETRAQTIFPHYFEKHETDGVDIGIYIGASLVEGGGYDTLYLRELRLWQLLVTCGLARKSAEILPRLKTKLETTHLVLAHNQPLSIRFRHDEKQFDVDGAYNIRYEIIKKRIDKATIKGTGERLTQPGMIAIVYTQPREASEYLEYIEFLGASGHLEPGVEELELDDLQGVQGLKALRVRVAIGDATLASDDATVPEEISQAIRAMAGTEQEL